MKIKRGTMVHVKVNASGEKLSVKEERYFTSGQKLMSYTRTIKKNCDKIKIAFQVRLLN